MKHKEHQIYEKEDFDKLDMKSSNRSLFLKLLNAMKKQNRVIDEMLMYEVEARALRRQVEYYKKRVDMLNVRGNYHTFTNIDKNLRRRENERYNKSSNEK